MLAVLLFSAQSQPLGTWNIVFKKNRKKQNMTPNSSAQSLVLLSPYLCSHLEIELRDQPEPEAR